MDSSTESCLGDVGWKVRSTMDMVIHVQPYNRILSNDVCCCVVFVVYRWSYGRTPSTDRHYS